MTFHVVVVDGRGHVVGFVADAHLVNSVGNARSFRSAPAARIGAAKARANLDMPDHAFWVVDTTPAPPAPTPERGIALDEARTVHHRSLATGREEVWEATSIDGRWHFARLEQPGTPWLVTHDDFPGWSMLAPSLPNAQTSAEHQLHLDLTVNLPELADHGS